MRIEQIYTSCLAHAAYYIESNGEAAIIDPLREVAPYISLATKGNATIKYVFETHFHADFVSGHLTIAEKTGATIVYGPEAHPKFDAHLAKDGEVFNIGNITLTLLHTPGHSMDSSCFLLKDENGKPHAIFTGDTLFLGDVGRPDLANDRVNLTKEDLAAYLFDSLHSKIMPLPDDLIVYPGHGAGSACGKNISKETVDTLKNQKETNYALDTSLTKDEFIKELTDDLPKPPAYFPHNVRMNIEGYPSIDNVLKNGLKPLSVTEFEQLSQNKNNIILDVRHQSEFIKGFIPNSIFIGIDGSFAPWVGALIKNVAQPILLVVPKGREEEVITRLSRIGFDNTLGYLNGGFEAWKTANKNIDTLESITALDLENIINNNDDVLVFDMRKQGEYTAEHIEHIENTPLDYIEDYFGKYPKNEKFYVHCQSGYRSVVAASILKNNGFDKVIDVAGGFKAIKETEIATTNYVCPSTLN